MLASWCQGTAYATLSGKAPFLASLCDRQKGCCQLAVGLQVNGYLGLNGQNRMRQRTYLVGHHVRYGYRFQPIVRHPSQSRYGMITIKSLSSHLLHCQLYVL